MRRTDFTNGKYYFLTNFGVEGRALFADNEDRVRFLEYMRRFRMTKDKPYLDQDSVPNVTFIAYSQCGNGFYFLVRQEREEGITEMMHQLGTGYSMYFNRKYNRLGRLFIGPFRAREVVNQVELLLVSKYVHACPMRRSGLVDPVERIRLLRGFLWSSYQDYIGAREGTLCDKNAVLSGIQDHDVPKWYQRFVESDITPDEKAIIQPFALEQL